MRLGTQLSCTAPGRVGAAHPSPRVCTVFAAAGPVEAASARRCGVTVGPMLYRVDCSSTDSLPSYMRAETQSRDQHAVPAVLPISGGACAMESPTPDRVFRLRGAALSSADLLEIADFSTMPDEASYTSLSVRCTDRQCLSVGVDSDGTLSILEITGTGKRTLTSATQSGQRLRRHQAGTVPGLRVRVVLVSRAGPIQRPMRP